MDNNQTPAPLSADSLHLDIPPTSTRTYWPTIPRSEPIEKAIAVLIAAELKSERQRIADSLPEKKNEICGMCARIPVDYGGKEIPMDKRIGYKCRHADGFNEALAVIRAVLIPPTGSSPTSMDVSAQGHEVGNSSEVAPQ